MGRRRRTDPPIRRGVGIGRGRRGTIIPSLDPITRRRGRGLSDLPRTRPSQRLPSRPRPRTRPSQRLPSRPRPLGTDFAVLQPLGRPRPRPTRVEVAQPSRREGRLITVSSRSILARTRVGRKKKKRVPFIAPRRFGRPSTPVRKAERSRAVRFGGTLGARTPSSRLARSIREDRSAVFESFIPFQEISFAEGRRREGRLGEFEEREERPRRTRSPPRRRRRSDDFGLGNIFDIQF